MSDLDFLTAASPADPSSCFTAQSGCPAYPVSFAANCPCYLAIEPVLEPQERQHIQALTGYHPENVPEDIWTSVRSLVDMWEGDVNFDDVAGDDAPGSLEIEFPKISVDADVDADTGLRGRFAHQPLCLEQLSQAKHLLFQALLRRPRGE